MALKGNCIYYEIVDTGETEEVNVTHPNGAEEVINTPKMEEVAHEYNDVYVVIQKIDTFHQYETTDEGVQKYTIVFCDIAGFESKEARDENPTNYLFYKPVPVRDYDYNSNIYAQSYNSVKQLKGFEDLTDI